MRLKLLLVCITRGPQDSVICQFNFFMACLCAGYLPFFVSATAGTTVIGAFDPLDQLADVCAKYDLWLHVDVSLYFTPFR